VVCDERGPAGALIAQLKNAGIQVETVSAAEHAQACGVLVDAVDQQRARHLGTPELAAAIKGAAKRPLGDAWAWSRKSSTVDISPLVAVTLALWKFAASTQSVYEGRGIFVT
jgi:ABC-type hemin transport system substrate-binding protein